MAHLRNLIADELRRNDEAASRQPRSPMEYVDDADAILRIVRDFKADQGGWKSEDRTTIDELETMVREARDKARWLGVHRRMKIAQHVEEILTVVHRMVVDVQGRHARKEKI